MICVPPLVRAILPVSIVLMSRFSLLMRPRVKRILPVCALVRCVRPFRIVNMIRSVPLQSSVVVASGKQRVVVIRVLMKRPSRTPITQRTVVRVRIRGRHLVCRR